MSHEASCCLTAVTIELLFHSLADLKTVSLAVAGVDLSDHLVEVVITLFDEDGKLTTILYSGKFHELVE